MAVTVVKGGDFNVFEVPLKLAALQSLSERWRQRATNVGMGPEAELFGSGEGPERMAFLLLFHRFACLKADDGQEFEQNAQHAKAVLASVGIEAGKT